MSDTFKNISQTKEHQSEDGGALIEVALLLALMLLIGVSSLTDIGQGANGALCQTWYSWRIAEVGHARNLSIEENTYPDIYCPTVTAADGITGYGG
jgi:hypothetical protein